ncbi:MAG TPA: hypothetical protein VFQ44_01900 [Streptosporangiaceae bacterium]|nr:hypothetical protein [Streptosporangiaceae bacterium]
MKLAPVTVEMRPGLAAMIEYVRTVAGHHAELARVHDSLADDLSALDAGVSRDSSRDGDVRVVWDMTGDEWKSLSQVLRQHLDVPYIAALHEAGKLDFDAIPAT